MHLLIDLAVAGVQVFVDLEPVELELFPEVLALLVHDVGDAFNVVLLLLHVLGLLFAVVVVGRPPFPQVIHLVDLHASGRGRDLCPQEVLDLLLKILVLLLLLDLHKG